AVLTLWQTSMLRGSRLNVTDEIANGLSYYDYFSARAASLLRGAGRPTRFDRSRLGQLPATLVPARWKLDRRRPRRQSLRHRRGPAPSVGHAERARTQILSR